jgi:N utilization substance protein A
VEKSGETGQVTVYVNRKSDLGIAIGKNGCNIEKARMLCRRYFGVEMGEVFVKEERT